MRRLLAPVGVLLMLAALTVGGSASPASAAAGFPDIDVRIWAYVCDDEVIDRRDNCGVHEMATRPLKVPTTEDLRWIACQGKEVVVDVELRTKRLSGNRAEIHAGVMFREGATCRTIDVERWDQQDFVITEGERVVKNFFWNNGERNADDSATVQLIFNDTK